MISRFFRPTGRIANAFPCPYPSGEGCPRRVVDHGANEFVAVCGESPARCDRVSITRADLLVQRLDLPRLCKEIATCLCLESSPHLKTSATDTWLLGTSRSSAATWQPVHLALPDSDEAFSHAVAELAMVAEGPFLLLTPTSHRTNVRALELLRRRNAQYLTLEELVAFSDRGELVALKSVHEVFDQTIATAHRPAYRFRHTGEFWDIAFGEEAASLGDQRGLHFLRALLREPNREFQLFEIEQSIGQKSPALDLPSAGDGGPILDQQAKAKFRERRRALDAELSEAEANHDLGTAERLRDEKEKLEADLQRAFGLGGQPRLQQDLHKRARDRVSQAVRRSRATLAEHLPRLAAHLNSTLKVGTLWSYRPEQRVDWQF